MGRQRGLPATDSVRERRIRRQPGAPRFGGSIAASPVPNWNRREDAMRNGSLTAILTSCIGILLTGGPASGFTPSGSLEIYSINVQQGASTLVIGPDGTTVLMDAGDDGKGAGEVVPYLKGLGLAPADGLDYTLASHLHDDHVGGFDEVFAAGYDVSENNWYNGSSHWSDDVQHYWTEASGTTAGLPQPIPLGHAIELGAGARLTVVAVAGEVLGGGFVAAAANNENDLSVAVLIEYGDFDYLWAGDLGGGEDDSDCTGRSTGQANVETVLAQAITPGGAAPRLSAEGVDVLHVNHHGSESSTNSDWMNRLRPEVAIIPVGGGQGGSFHHPRRDVVEGVLLGGAPCIEAPPVQLVLQTEEGSPVGASTSFAGYAVGDLKLTTDGSGYRIEASGQVSQGPDERAAAGLPRAFSGDEASGDGACVPDDSTLCFLDNRFQVRVAWERPNGESGVGHALPVTDRAGLFYFFHPDNLEMLIKMIDACSLDDRFWVFYAATTNVEFQLSVTDLETGAAREYFNPQGHPAPPVQDTGAFDTCEAPPPPPPPPAGVVVLSEVFYDAQGGDNGLEWVEIYNAGTAAVDLSAYSLGNGGDDYTYSKVQLSGVVAPGATWVVGGPTGGSANGHPDFDQLVNFDPDFQNSGTAADGVALFDRRSSQVGPGTVPIDAVIYGPVNSGGLIDETGTASPPEVDDAEGGSSIERLDLAGHWRIQAHPTPNAAPPLG
jgi:beta-lactamase superfamily II metal-dependent hydrolase